MEVSNNWGLELRNDVGINLDKLKERQPREFAYSPTDCRYWRGVMPLCRLKARPKELVSL